jgi:hypothetical protein
MKARIIIDNAPLGPDELRLAREAFDGAWETIAARYDVGSVERARERLAKLILSLLSDTQDPAEIKAIAVQEMTKDV